MAILQRGPSHEAFRDLLEATLKGAVCGDVIRHHLEPGDSAVITLIEVYLCLPRRSLC